MSRNVVTIDLDRIVDWESFHSVFAEALGFPDFYGRNLDAWIDCMTSIDDPGGGAITRVTVRPGEMLTLHLDGMESLAVRCPDIHRSLLDVVAFVNWRRIKDGEGPVLALAYVR